jgi:hypothetical protein
MVRLFGVLRDRFQETSSVWDRFSRRHDSDLLYFSDLQSLEARSALNKIEKSFERLEILEMTVTRLRGEAQTATEMVGGHHVPRGFAALRICSCISR